MERYRSVNAYFKEQFKEKVYKLALDANFTCPNRDGTIGFGGCVFCAGGAGEFAEKGDDIKSRIERAKSRISQKTAAKKFIAYFQSYTNTYAPVKRLEQIFFEAVQTPEVVAISIATRPDCLPDDVLLLLKKLNDIKPVFVELGLQTSNESTATLIRRGYPLSVYDKAVKDLKNIGINVVTHVILGLPYESKETMLKTVKHVAKAGSNGIKLQLLHVLKGTDLEKMYINREFSTLSFEDYLDVLCDAIEILPLDIIIHRLTGDAPKRLLIAPEWSADKKRVLNGINAEFEKRNVIQGKKYLNSNRLSTKN